ncbi:MAG: hypothetical protein V1835_01980 [Candidatus Micrarchaeota archaeon]
MEEEKQLQDLKEETHKKNLEVKKLAEENSKNIAKLRELLDTAEEQRKLRDDYNAKVKEISEKRRSLIEQSKKIDTELRELEAESAKIKEPQTRIPLPRLERMIDELEWRQQTQSMSVKDENAFSKQIKELLKEKQAIMKSQPLRKRIYELHRKRQELSMEFRALDGAQELNAKESDKHHETMLKSYKKADETRAKISEYLEKIGEKRKDADDTYSKMREVRDGMQDEERKHYSDEKHERKMKEDERRDELEERAREIYIKFKAGKKISMDELQILQMAGLEI